MLEELLERVRTEVGPDARIVAANRVRKGGVGGFFAKQAFEVLVEADDAAPPPRAHRRHGREHGHRCFTRATPLPAPAGAADARAAGRAPATILELADAVSDDERSNVIDLVEERSVSTETRDFARGARPVQPARSTRPPRSSATRASTTAPTTTGLRHRPPRDGAGAGAGADPSRDESLPIRCRPSPPKPPDRPPADDDVDLRNDPFGTRPRRAQRSARRGAPPNRPRASSTATRPGSRGLGLPAQLIPRGVARERAEGRARRVAHAAAPAAERSRGPRRRHRDRRRRRDAGAARPRSRNRPRSRPRRRRARDPRAARLRHPGVAADERRRDRAGTPPELAAPRPADDRRVQPAARRTRAALGARAPRRARAHDHVGHRRRRRRSAKTSRTASTRSAASTCSRSTVSTTR